MATEPVLPSHLSPPPFTDEDLDAALCLNWPGDDVPDTAPVEPEAVRQVERWTIADERSAEWAVRRVKELQAAVEAAEANAAEWHREIDRWLDGTTKPLKWRTEFFTGHLRRWLAGRMKADPKLRSVKLPSGTVWSRTPTEPKVEVVDGDEVAAWLGARVTAAVSLAASSALVAAGVELSDLQRAALRDALADGVSKALYGDPVLRSKVELAVSGFKAAAVAKDVGPEGAERLVPVIDGEVVPGVRLVAPETTYGVR